MGNRLLPPEVDRRLLKDYLGDRGVGRLRLKVFMCTLLSWQRELRKSRPRHPLVGEILGVPDAIFLPGILGGQILTSIAHFRWKLSILAGK